MKIAAGPVFKFPGGQYREKKIFMPDSASNPPQPAYALDWPAWAARLLRLYARTFRFRVLNAPSEMNKANIFALWHEKQLAVLSYFGPFGCAVLASLSRDGGYISRGAQILGYNVIRGSSSRGGLEALWRMMAGLRDGLSVILTVDGPRGPRRQAKPGAAILAAKTGCPIYPAGIVVDRKWVLKSWDKMIVPWPFARVVTYFGDPLVLPKEAAKWPKKELSRLVDKAMILAEQKARGILDDWLAKPSSARPRPQSPPPSGGP